LERRSRQRRKGNNGSEAMTDIDAYDLAMLAAQLMCRQNTPANAVETAWSLLDEAKLKLDGVRLKALAKSPEAQTESDRREAERLANLQIPYEKGVKLVVSVDRWSGEYGALKWFKKFLRVKATKQEKTMDGIEARAEAWLTTYRSRGFTGTEVKKLQDEFNRWRTKGKQGRVKKKKTDGRLRENRQRKAEEKAQKAWADLTGEKAAKRSKPELEYVADTEATEGQAIASGKTPGRDSATLVRDADAPNL